MGEDIKGPSNKNTNDLKEDEKWVLIKMDDCNTRNEDSSFSDESSSSFETSDDASSSFTSNSSSAQSSGCLYDLSDLMAQLPIKRGLSKYYQGKSQSFTSLSRVTSIQHLAKKEMPYRRKMNACMSYEGGLDNFRSYTLPKPIISEKNSKGSFSSSSSMSRRGSVASSFRPPHIPVQKN